MSFSWADTRVTHGLGAVLLDVARTWPSPRLAAVNVVDLTPAPLLWKYRTATLATATADPGAPTHGKPATTHQMPWSRPPKMRSTPTAFITSRLSSDHGTAW